MSANQNTEKQQGMFEEDFNETFFKKVLTSIDPMATLTSFQRSSMDRSTAILSGFDADKHERILGLVCFELTYETKDGGKHAKKVVMKVKPNSFSLWQGINGLIQMIGGRFAEIYNTKFKESELYQTELKDLACLGLDNKVFKSLQPRVYHIFSDPERDIFGYAMENLREDRFTHLDSVMDVSVWTEQDIKDALSGVAGFHALYFGQTEKIPEELAEVLDPRQTVEFHNDMIELWPHFTEHAHKNFPQLFDAESYAIMQKSFANYREVCKVFDAAPITLIHNDFNVRNVCLRKNPAEGEKRLCLYDWEIVRYGLPQHDVAEFLAFILPADSTEALWHKYAEFYRQALLSELQSKGASDELQSSVKDKGEFQRYFDMAVIYLFWNRVTSYHVVHYFNKLPFLERVMKNTTGYLKTMSKKYDFLS